MVKVVIERSITENPKVIYIIFLQQLLFYRIILMLISLQEIYFLILNQQRVEETYQN